MRRATSQSAVLGVILGLAIGPAAAASLTAQEVLQQFNVVATGDVTSNSHVDGRTYVGGNVDGGTYGQHAAPASDYAGLTAVGNVTGVHVNNQGAVIGGNLTNSTVNSGSSVVSGNASNSNFNGPAYVKGTAVGTNFNGGTNPSLATSAAAKAAASTNLGGVLTGLSTQLSHLTSTGSSVTFNGNKAVFNATVDPISGLAVFDLTGIDTQLFSMGEFDFNLNGAQTVVLNTDVTSADFSINFLGGSAHAIGAATIWNFYNATDLTIHNEFGGTILAMGADFTNYNNIEGSVLVNNLSQYGEIHSQPFTGNIPPVPEPETYVLLLSGLGVIGIMARRRRNPLYL